MWHSLRYPNSRPRALPVPATGWFLSAVLSALAAVGAAPVSTCKADPTEFQTGSGMLEIPTIANSGETSLTLAAPSDQKFNCMELWMQARESGQRVYLRMTGTLQNDLVIAMDQIFAFRRKKIVPDAERKLEEWIRDRISDGDSALMDLRTAMQDYDWVEKIVLYTGNTERTVYAVLAAVEELHTIQGFKITPGHSQRDAVILIGWARRADELEVKKKERTWWKRVKDAVLEQEAAVHDEQELKTIRAKLLKVAHEAVVGHHDDLIASLLECGSPQAIHSAQLAIAENMARAYTSLDAESGPSRVFLEYLIYKGPEEFREQARAANYRLELVKAIRGLDWEHAEFALSTLKQDSYPLVRSGRLIGQAQKAIQDNEQKRSVATWQVLDRPRQENGDPILVPGSSVPLRGLRVPVSLSGAKTKSN